MPMALVPLAGGRPIPLDKAIVLFGRGQECDVVLAASRKVSRKHCCIAQIDDRYVVRDLGSMNGLRVNGAQVEREALLSTGDELCIGDQVFRMQPLGKHKLGIAVDPSPPRSATPPAKKPIDPYLVSADIPIVIPDEDEDFAVEATGAQRVPLADFADSDDEIIELRDEDLL